MIKKLATLLILFALPLAIYAIPGAVELPFPLEGYKDENITGVWNIIKHRAKAFPFNIVATIIFLSAVIHTFVAFKFQKMAERMNERHRKKIAKDQEAGHHEDVVSFRAEVLHFLGEIEAVFIIWVIPLMLATIVFFDWKTLKTYINEKVIFIEPVFVVVIMAIAASKPILKFAEQCMSLIAGLGKKTPLAWWFSILTVAPLLGSFITEPAAMTIAALLIGQQFYALKPSTKLAYATLGLLFVNISIGGTLTHFAAPPILMVASTWDWDMQFTFTNFGWKAVTSIITSNFVYFLYFRKEFAVLKQAAKERDIEFLKSVGDAHITKDRPIPAWITIIHLLFLIWTVMNLHYMSMFIGGFLFFIAFTQATMHHQYSISLKTPMLVGIFLAGLVTHGGLQGWWIEPVLSSLDEFPLFFGSVVLTAFNDNAAITYLASLVPEFANNVTLQKAVVEGAVTGGGLTIIANAPNPAGRSILDKYFPNGLSPLGLFLGALIPTAVASFCFMGIRF